jgi:signal transduction histidine kinase
MKTAHEIRGRLHTARLHVTFLERTFGKPGSDPEVVEAVNATADELRHLERMVLALLALSPLGEDLDA